MKSKKRRIRLFLLKKVIVMTELNFLSIHLEAGNKIYIRNDKKNLKYKDEGYVRRIPLVDILKNSYIDIKTHKVGKYKVYELYIAEEQEYCINCNKSYKEDSTNELYCDLEEIKVDLYYRCRFYNGDHL